MKSKSFERTTLRRTARRGIPEIILWRVTESMPFRYVKEGMRQEQQKKRMRLDRAD